MKTLVLLLSAGCTVMVNGKPHHLGGSDPAATTPGTTPVATTTNPAAPGAPTPTPTTPGAPAAPAVPGQVITVDATLTSTPVIATVGQVAFDSRFSKQFGNGNSPDCGSEMTSRPIASLDLKQPMESLEVTVSGGSNDGFVLAYGKSLWFACTQTIGSLPSISKLKEGWQPGRYDIYAVTRYAGKAHQPFEVEVVDTSKPAAWPAKLKTITIAGKLATPMFVEVTTQPGRRKLRAERGGWGCEKDALPNDPDLALAIERPIPGLVVRPLPSATPVVLRRELREGKKPDKGCPTSGNGREGPSYHADHELHFDHEDEGTFGISLGTADASHPTTVTLMIFDKSTKLDALAPFPYTPTTDSIAERWLGNQFPQLDLDELDIHREYSRAELAAKVFALAPKTAFVYSKLDLDKDLANGPSDAFPTKNEALLVIGINREQINVMAADGLRYTVKDTHLLLAPDGTAVVPSAPRALHKLDIGSATSLLPPSGKALATARAKRVAAKEACVDRVWAPYGRQIPTYTHPAGVDIVIVESPATRRIKDAGNDAVDRQCGTAQADEKQTEVDRVKMVAEIEKARAKLLVQATAAWR